MTNPDPPGDEATAPGIPLRLGIDGRVIGTAVIAEDGTMRATVTDPDAAAALSTPPRWISLRFDRAEHERLVHDDPVLAAQVREGIAEAERGETADLGSFAQYLEACREFRVACVALFWAVAEGLRLPQFLSWLSRRLGGDGA